MGCSGPFRVPVRFVKATGAAASRCFTGHGTAAPAALGERRAPVTAAPRCSRPRLRASADLGRGTRPPGGMGGEAGSAAAVGAEGRVKSLGLVFADERKGCYSSGETVAGHVLLEAAAPLALSALRLEAQGRATAAWGQGSGAAPAASSEVEYLNVRLSLREPPAGERWTAGGRAGGAGRRWGSPLPVAVPAGFPGDPLEPGGGGVRGEQRWAVAMGTGDELPGHPGMQAQPLWPEDPSVYNIRTGTRRFWGPLPPGLVQDEFAETPVAVRGKWSPSSSGQRKCS